MSVAVAVAPDDARIAAQLGTCDVLPGLHDLRVRYARAVNARVVERCRAALPDQPALAQRLDELAAHAAASTWTEPQLVLACYEGADAHGWGAVLDALQAPLHAADPPPPRPCLAAREHAPERWVDVALRTCEGDVQRDGHASRITARPPGAAELDALAIAFELLERGWPAMADAVRGLVRDVVWQQALVGPSVRSATFAQVHGLVLLQAGIDPVETLAAIVHETTHLDVMMRTTIDRLVCNDHERGSSPFRQRQRPLGRVLHAAVVCARMTSALECCAPLLDAGSADQARALARGARDDLGRAFTTLERSGRFTPAGDALMDSLAASVARREAQPAA